METPERPRRRFLPAAAALVAAAALGGIGAAAVVTALDDSENEATPVAATTTTQTTSPPPSTVATGDLDVAALYERVAPGVVELEVTRNGGGGLGPGGRTSGGSGFVLDERGHIITNEHVVADAGEVLVRFADGSEATATVVGTDPGSDIAVVRVDPEQVALAPLELGSSADLRPGEPVIAIGNPLGFEGSVTAGIVSGLDRTIEAPDGTAINGAIQTDAALNNGNSGGPLLDAEGKVVGVNAQVRSPTLGFAIPIDTVKDIAARLMEGGEIERGFLGVRPQTVTDTAAEELDLPRGAQIVAVEEGTPAARAELSPGDDEETVGGLVFTRDGDVITAVDGEPITSAEDLQAAIASREPGDRVRLTVSRSGEERTVTVTLAERPS